MNDQRIAVITDSGTDTPPDFCRAHDVRVVPLRITYSNGESYESGVDITSEEVERRFAEEVPKTSLPSPARIQAALEQARSDGYERAVFVTISAGLSATNQTATLVAGQMEGFPTIVANSRSIGVAAGLEVERAVELVEGGVPFERLERQLEGVARANSVFFAVKSLDYLYKGGRINGSVYKLGSMLNIKPVMRCDEAGYYVVCKKARGWDRAMDGLVQLASKEAKGFSRCRLAVCCSAATREHQDELARRIREAAPSVERVTFSGISADLIVHTGPDLVGVGVQGL